MMLRKNLEYLQRVSNLTNGDISQFLAMSVKDYASLNSDDIQLDALESLSDLYNVEPYDLLTTDLSQDDSGFITKPVHYEFSPTTHDLKEIAHFHCLIRNYVKMSKLLSETN